MEKIGFHEDTLVDSDEEICKLGGIFCSQCVVLQEASEVFQEQV